MAGAYVKCSFYTNDNKCNSSRILTFVDLSPEEVQYFEAQFDLRTMNRQSFKICGKHYSQYRERYHGQRDGKYFHIVFN